MRTATIGWAGTCSTVSHDVGRYRPDMSRAERTASSFFCAVVLLHCSLAGQDALRAAHAGRCIGTEGQPVAGAEVTFVATPMGEGDAADDVVQTKSDENGRFKVGLLPSVRYVAWAARRTDAGTIVSAPVERAVTTTIAFGHDDGVAPARWRVNGLDRWKDHGPMRVQLRVLGNTSLLRAAALDAAGYVALPPLPNVTCEALFFCGERPVHIAGHTLRQDTMLPPPHHVEAVVVDDQGKPVAGASIGRLAIAWSTQIGPFVEEIRGRRLELAVADAAGKARLLVAHDQNPFLGVPYPPMVFVASKPGLGDAISALGEGRCENGKFAPVDPKDVDAAVLTMTMSGKAPLQRKCLGMPETANVSVSAFGSVILEFAGNMRTSVDERVVRTATADGTFELPSSAVGREFGAFRAKVPLPSLADDDPFRRVRANDTLVLPPANVFSGGDLDLRAVVPLRLQVLDASKGPAVAAQVLAVPRNGDAYLNPRYGAGAVTDGAGRCVLATLTGEWFVIVVHGATFAALVVDVRKDLAPTSVNLEPMPTMAVRVVDAEGHPVANATFECTSASWGSGGTDPEGDVIAALAYSIAKWRIGTMRSDAEGHAALPFVKNSRTQVEFVARSGDRSSDEMKLVPSGDATEVVLRPAR